MCIFHERDECVSSKPPVKPMEAGFSVLEVMVALFVLLFGFISMAQLIATSIVVNRNSFRLTSLTQLAAEKLEELRSMPLDNERFEVVGNPEFATATLASVGSLTADTTQTLQDSGGVPHTVSFYDWVFVDQRAGSITRTAGPGDTDGYNSVTRTLAGSSSLVTQESAPTRVSYRRRWLIEGNQPLPGNIRITVELAVPAAAGKDFRQVIRLSAVR